jgi:hypothetical protein
MYGTLSAEKYAHSFPGRCSLLVKTQQQEPEALPGFPKFLAEPLPHPLGTVAAENERMNGANDSS